MDLKPIALQLYTLRDDAKVDYVKVLKTVANFGFVGVETAGTYGVKPAEFRKVLDGLGLVCCSTHGGMPNKENINERVDEASALGTKYMISGLGKKDFQTADAAKASMDRLAQAVDLARSAGMHFGYHNHWWEFDKLDGALPYEMCLAAVPDMFSELDIYWASGFGQVDVPKLIAKHANRMPMLHVKDGPLVQDQPHLAVGKGKMDIPACIKAADPKTLKWLIVELDECATNMAQAVGESYQYMIGQGLAKGRK